MIAKIFLKVLTLSISSRVVRTGSWSISSPSSSSLFGFVILWIFCDGKFELDFIFFVEEFSRFIFGERGGFECKMWN